jgi:hypothetical protein
VGTLSGHNHSETPESPVKIQGPPPFANRPRLIAASLLTCFVLLPWLTADGVQSASGGATPQRQVLQVGPRRELKRPSDAAKVARDGALVEIDAGVYEGDVAVWLQSGLTLRGLGGRAQIKAAGKAAEGKAVWVIKGNLVEIDNVELSGARVPAHNGAGIRAEGAGLTIHNSRLYDNEMGILTSNNADSLVIIEGSEIDHNRTDTEAHGKLGHNIYIGRIGRFVLRDSKVHDAHQGHQVKTRAARSSIYKNDIRDGEGDSSYLIDLAEGGEAEISANQLEQGPRSPNRTAISFAAEAEDENSGHALTVSRNRFVNKGRRGTFVRNHAMVEVILTGNRLEGDVTPLEGPGRVSE